MPGEREIRDTADHLRKYQGRSAKLKHIEVLPLFARLSIEDQQKIFKPHSARRIVLATNVAETSLTVPGIKYVIDAGLARMNRYSTRAKVEQLQIEKISQAAAKQRAGRCGRVSNGICVRLYSEQDFDGRPEFTAVSYTHLDVYKRQGQVIGIETRADLVEKSKALAAECGFDRMRFEHLTVEQSINSDTLPSNCLLYTSRCV